MCVEARELAMLGDGSPAPVGTADEDLFYPCCFRDGSEIRPATDGEQRRPAPALIGAAGTGLICSAVLTTDPVGGYPPGTPDALTRLSRTGAAHNLAAVPLFVGLPAAALVCGWRSWRAGRRGFGLYSAATAVTMLATMALAAAGFGQSPRLVNVGGLFQRASIITGIARHTALSHEHSTVRPPPAAPGQARAINSSSL